MKQTRALRTHIKRMEKLLEGNSADVKEQRRMEVRQRKELEHTTRVVLSKVRAMRENKRTNSNVETGGGVKRKR